MNANFDYERSEISNNVKIPNFIYLSGWIVVKRAVIF